MPNFKYLVANQEGKKLSGSVQAPDRNTAQEELNNLGFSILSLEESNEEKAHDPSLKKFAFEAVDKSMKLVTGTIPAADEKQAFTRLETEYSLQVSALWPETATSEEITAAKAKGTAHIKETMDKTEKKEVEAIEAKTKEQQEKEQFVKLKIEKILASVNELLKRFENEIDPNQKTEINKKIDKILRIKHSTNLDYILESAKELLEFIQKQETHFQEKGFKDKRLELNLRTQNLLDELKRGQKEQSLSENIVSSIENWQQSNTDENQNVSYFKQVTGNFLNSIKKVFETPEEIKAIKDQVKVYNRQLWDLIRLYFKEPTKEYKEKVKRSIKTVWLARQTALNNLKHIKRELRKKRKFDNNGESFLLSLTKEINSFSGWLLAFYIAYYFTGLYITNKDFGLHSVPKGFFIYESHIFKYVLVITFILHSCTALKVNFFKKSLAADIILIPSFFLLSIISVLNF